MFVRHVTRARKVATPLVAAASRRNLSQAAAPAQADGKIWALRAAAGAMVLGGCLYNGPQAHAAAPTNIDAVKQDIMDAIDADEEKREDGTSMGPTLVRLAWHCAGTYSSKDQTGGSNGATMRYAPESDWGANAGLGLARAFLEPIKAKYPDLSYADLYTLSGVTAIEKMGGPMIRWRPGRTDSPTPTTVPDGRLPGADKGCPKGTIAHLRDIFNRMGFRDDEIVALSGAHVIGSGYWGPWSYSETTFSNEYFRLLLEEKWTVKKTHNGKPWTGPMQYESPDGKLMMLPSDLALIQDETMKKWVELFAKDEGQFNKAFSVAFSKLLELGVTFPKTGIFGLGIGPL